MKNNNILVRVIVNIGQLVKTGFAQGNHHSGDLTENTEAYDGSGYQYSGSSLQMYDSSIKSSIR